MLNISLLHSTNSYSKNAFVENSNFKMRLISNKLEKLGFNRHFAEQVTPEQLESFDIARVVAVHRDSYAISDGQNDVLAELVGKLIYGAATPLDYPAVGDWVLVNFFDGHTFAIIHEVLPRKSLLKRKTPGKKVEFQLIAANIDVAFIVQSLDANFNLNRLERYLVMINEGHIKPAVLLSKSDLLAPDAVASRIAEIKKVMPDLPVQSFSNKNESGLDNIEGLLKSGMTYCLLGSSGVGKTTLLNNLIGESRFETKTVRDKDGKGRHATTARQLILIDGGAMVIDTPGMRELGNFAITTGLDETFAEIAALAQQCQFNDCTHRNEKGCAVLAALAEGRLSGQRYDNFIKMSRESAYHEMSYLEKRQKDRQFGKFVKSVMKHKKNWRE